MLRASVPKVFFKTHPVSQSERGFDETSQSVSAGGFPLGTAVQSRPSACCPCREPWVRNTNSSRGHPSPGPVSLCFGTGVCPSRGCPAALLPGRGPRSVTPRQGGSPRAGHHGGSHTSATETETDFSSTGIPSLEKPLTMNSSCPAGTLESSSHQMGEGADPEVLVLDEFAREAERSSPGHCITLPLLVPLLLEALTGGLTAF